MEGTRLVYKYGAEIFPFTNKSIDIFEDKKNANFINLFKDWKIFGNEVDPYFLQSKMAVAIFIGNSTGDGATIVFDFLKRAYIALSEKLAVIYVPYNEVKIYNNIILVKLLMFL